MSAPVTGRCDSRGRSEDVRAQPSPPELLGSPFPVGTEHVRVGSRPCSRVSGSRRGGSETCSRVCTAGTLQEAMGPQEQVGEELSHTLHLEEVVQETASEWQALANVF